MKILHVQGIFSPEHGGPAQSLAQYCIGQAHRGHQVSAWVLEGFPHTSSAIGLPAPVETTAYPVKFPSALGRSPSMRRALATTGKPDVFHLHGTWLRAMHYGAKEARRRQVPYLVELMGMYEPYGLRTKWLRKRMARWWFQDALLQRADCLHVNSVREGEHLRRLGFTAPLAEIPVGVDTKAIDERRKVAPADAPWPQLDDRSFVLYLSRIHPKKGIELLLQAWASIVKDFPDVILAIAGSGTPVYLRDCQTRAESFGIGKRCVWLGQVSEAEKTWLYQRALFYVLPSYSENFGNTVAEALAHETPVITTPHTAWGRIVEEGSGLLTEPALEPLQDTLREALLMGDEARREMGSRGRRWIDREFSLSSVITQIDQIYGWMLGGSKPPTVF